MSHVLPELARERQRAMLADAEALRDGRRAAMRGKATRRLERIERSRARRGHQAARLRAELELE